MLNNLSQFDPETAQGILASLTLGMMPAGVEHQYEVDPELREKILNELRFRLRLKRNDNSPKALAKLYQALADEMGGLALSGVDKKELKARLGQKGLLSPGQYKIQYSEQFKEIAEKRGAHRPLVENAIRRPDSVEHMHPELEVVVPGGSTTLFLKTFFGNAAFENHLLLIFSARRGDILTVGDAWMVFPSDVDLSKASTPLDVLRAFVGTYGEELVVGQTPGKFFWYERIHYKQGQSIQLIGFNRPSPETDMSLIAQIGEKGEGYVDIAHAFLINDTKYINDLRRHGIRVST